MSGDRGGHAMNTTGGGYGGGYPATTGGSAAHTAGTAATNAGTQAVTQSILGANPITMILGSVAGAVIGGIFDAIQAEKNRKEMARQQKEAREMAERQFAWGQHMDRFNMNQTDRMNTHAISQDRINQINEALRTNVGLQNHVRSLWARR